MAARHSRLGATLAAAWEGEVVSSLTLAGLAAGTCDVRARARLMVLSAFCRVHASRLMARLTAMGRGPLPVPPEEILPGEDFCEAILDEAKVAHASATRYEQIAALAREQADLSSVWVLELNRAEEEDRARELERLASNLKEDGEGAGMSSVDPSDREAPL